MNATKLVAWLFAGAVSGCATQPPSAFVAAAHLPNCFDANYDARLNLFTMRNAAENAVNQQCALIVAARGAAVAGSSLEAGRYVINLSGGGGGGAGGTLQLMPSAGGLGGGGGAGGGGAGAREFQTTVLLTEGTYRFTIGAGGPGGTACVPPPFNLSGGPGWLGSPSNIVRISTGEVVAGIPGAEGYVRPSRAQNDRSAGPMDGHGGYGPGQASGGRGGTAGSMEGVRLAQSGESFRPRAAAVGMGGTGAEDLTSAGGGGGGTSMANGGLGGGERPGYWNRPPQRGLLGSGGGGGEGSTFECDAGAPGGNGYIALRPMTSGIAAMSQPN